jgi:LmbE family N-acetylglucosaminyl deacetylase
MMRLGLRHTDAGPRRILCLGAHCDDIEIGCGGTVLDLTERRRDVSVTWVVFSGDETREREARASAALFLAAARASTVTVHRFRDGFFPYVGAQIKEAFEALKRTIAPDLVLTHHGADRHQDHRLISELTWNTFRDQLILEYEIPKYDGDFGSPNVLVELDETICERKIRHLVESFKTQHAKPWFTEDTFRAVLRLRGMEANSPTRFAEGFYARKLVL